MPARTLCEDILTERSETKQKTLEEIAAAFGDKVVLLTDADLVTTNSTTFKATEASTSEAVIEDGDAGLPSKQL